MSLAVVVLAGGGSRRFGADKLAVEVDGVSLLDRALAGLPDEASVYVVGEQRRVARPVTWLREDPPGGGPAAALVRGLQVALDAGATLLAVLPGDAPDAGRAARALIGRLHDDPALLAVVAVGQAGQEQPLQLALRRPAAAQLIAAAGPNAGANASARRLVRALDPAPARHRLAPAEVWDIDTRAQLLIWQLSQSEPVVALVARAESCRAGSDRPVVVALDGPSCSGKSTLAAAIQLRTAATVVPGDDFYGSRLPVTTAAERTGMSDDQVVDAVFDWRRMRAGALVPLRAGRAATYRPYDWAADDGRLGPVVQLPPAVFIVVEGVYSGRPELADLVDVAAYVGVDPAVRAQRRDARQNDPDWVDLWERGETHYFAHLRPPESFDVRLGDVF